MKVIHSLLITACFALSSTSIGAQDNQGFIGGTASDVPDEILQEIEDSRNQTRDSDFRESNNQLTADQLDTLTLIRVYRLIDSSERSELTKFQSLISSEEMTFIKAELQEAYDFAIARSVTRRERMCDAWQLSRNVSSDAVELSLREYDDQDGRIQPEIDNRFQSSLTRIASRLDNEARSEFLKALNPIRRIYETAHVSTFSSIALASGNARAELNKICDIPN